HRSIERVVEWLRGRRERVCLSEDGCFTRIVIAEIGSSVRRDARDFGADAEIAARERRYTFSIVEVRGGEGAAHRACVAVTREQLEDCLREHGPASVSDFRIRGIEIDGGGWIQTGPVAAVEVSGAVAGVSLVEEVGIDGVIAEERRALAEGIKLRILCGQRVVICQTAGP